jgi:uncharacterized protein (UPF0128 family)
MSATFLSLLSSCQKEESNNQPGFSSNIIEQKVTTWLDSKSKAYSISNHRLKNELQYSKLFQKKINDGGKFIVIPLKESHFETSHANKNCRIPWLTLFFMKESLFILKTLKESHATLLVTSGVMKKSGF